MFRQALLARHGQKRLEDGFVAFDTICSATEDRQRAIRAMASKSLDAMIVIGGYNSSNTVNLAKIAASFTRVFHIEDASSIVGLGEIRHKPHGSREQVVTRGWLESGPRTIGLTAGASTPNSQIGEAVERIVSFRDTIGSQLLRDLVHGSQTQENESHDDHP